MTFSGYSALAAMLFVLPALYTVIFQLAVTFGAPWGHLTLGGRWPGALPPPIRLLSFLQALLAVAMIVAVLDRGGVIALGWPDWAYYATVAMCALSTLANAATPSKPERRLGLPIAALMLVTAVLAGLL